MLNFLSWRLLLGIVFRLAVNISLKAGLFLYLIIIIFKCSFEKNQIILQHA